MKIYPTNRRRFAVLCLVLLVAIIAGFQTHTFPALDTNNIFTGSNTFSGTVATKNENNVLYSLGYSATDWCAGVTAADAALGAGAGWIGVNAATAATCATAPTLSAQHAVVFLEGGNYALPGTWTLPSGAKVIGVGGGPNESSNSSTKSGVTLNYTGATTGIPVVKAFDVSHLVFDGVNVNCNGVSNSIGIQYDSNNSPGSSLNRFSNWTVSACHQAVVVGLASNVATSAASCNITPSQAGCYQMDTVIFEHFNIYGSNSDLTGEGFHVNSANAMQSSRISMGNIQAVNIAVHVIATNGVWKIESVNDGSMLGTTPFMFVFEATVSLTPDLFENESESPTGAVLDHANPPLGTPSTPTWIGNSFNNTVTCDGALEQITSIGDTGSGTTFTATGGCKVTAINTAKWGPSATSVYTWNQGLIVALQATLSGGNGLLLAKTDGTTSATIANDTAGGIKFVTNGGSTWELFNSGRLVSPAGQPWQLIEGTPTLTAGSTIDSCAGSSTTHTPVCNFNNGNNPHPLRTTEVGTCTMASGTCTVTWSNPYNVAPIVSATWNGTGTFTTGASLKCTATTTNSVCTSSTGTDTAVIMVTGTGNPN